MPDVLIRNMPDHVYRELKRRAEQERRSVPAESVYLLEQLFQQEEAREKHRQAMHSIIERSSLKKPVSIDPVILLREDRER